MTKRYSQRGYPLWDFIYENDAYISFDISASVSASYYTISSFSYNARKSSKQCYIWCNINIIGASSETNAYEKLTISRIPIPNIEFYNNNLGAIGVIQDNTFCSIFGVGNVKSDSTIVIRFRGKYNISLFLFYRI